MSDFEYTPELKKIIKGDSTKWDAVEVVIWLAHMNDVASGYLELAVVKYAALQTERDALQERVRVLEERVSQLTCKECDSRIRDDGNCMMGHWCGKPGL
jgi:hypothetical protein